MFTERPFAQRTDLGQHVIAQNIVVKNRHSSLSQDDQHQRARPDISDRFKAQNGLTRKMGIMRLAYALRYEKIRRKQTSSCTMQPNLKKSERQLGSRHLIPAV